MLRTNDSFLGGQIKVLQPKSGYRAGSDAVLLAAFVAPSHTSILDIGCGVGTVSLCLAHRLEGTQIWGIDRQKELVDLALENASQNSFQGRLHFFVEDIRASAPVSQGSPLFEAVCSNPPYFHPSRPSKDASRALARTQSISLKKWVEYCFSRLCPKGYLYLIYPASELTDLIKALENFGGIHLYPVWTFPSGPCKRVLVRAQKGSKAPSVLLPGLVLHDPALPISPTASGRVPLSSQAEDIMRHGKGIFF